MVAASRHPFGCHARRLDHPLLVSRVREPRHSEGHCDAAQVREFGSSLLTLCILVDKVAVSFLAICDGFTIGCEGPTIHAGVLSRMKT